MTASEKFEDMGFRCTSEAMCMDHGIHQPLITGQVWEHLLRDVRVHITYNIDNTYELFHAVVITNKSETSRRDLTESEYEVLTEIINGVSKENYLRKLTL